MVLGLFALLIATDPTGAAPPPPEKPKLVCRESEAQLGSHMRSGRRCMTAEEWQQDDARRDRIPVTLRITGDPDDAQRAAARPH